jgi:hypothetical protein
VDRAGSGSKKAYREVLKGKSPVPQEVSRTRNRAIREKIRRYCDCGLEAVGAAAAGADAGAGFAAASLGVER